MKNPKHQVVVKFSLLLSLLLAYFLYLTLQYDFVTGGIAALITWSFFVLCTPVADAGFLLDFPIRLLFGIRMMLSEIVVWAVAISINVVSLVYFPDFYQTTALTKLMQAILTTPFPYWMVVLLSGIGTFLSIHFGDELLDVLHHTDRAYFHSHHFKHELILFAFFLLVIYGYYDLISTLGIEIDSS